MGTKNFFKWNRALWFVFSIQSSVHGRWIHSNRLPERSRLVFLYDVFVVCVCADVPNAGDGLKRLSYKQEWDVDLRAYMKKLDQTKPVVLCGDLNVAHQEIGEGGRGSLVVGWYSSIFVQIILLSIGLFFVNHLCRGGGLDSPANESLPRGFLPLNIVLSPHTLRVGFQIGTADL